MTLKIYNTIKVKNSTKVPAVGELVLETNNFHFKDSTSIHNPVILVTMSYQIAKNANVISIEGVFYFVDDVISVANNLWELHCSQDLLATNKSAIETTSLFYERTAEKLNPVMGDQYVTPIYGRQSSGKKELDDTPGYDETGCYVVRIVDNAPLKVYLMKPEEFSLFMQSVMSFFAIADKIKFISSVRYVKLNWDVFPGGVQHETTNIVVGSEVISLGFEHPVKFISSPVDFGQNLILYGATFNVFGDWRDSDPRFATYQMEVYGEKRFLSPIVRKFLHHYSALFNPMDCTMQLKFYDSNDNLIEEIQKQIGADIPLEKIGYNPLEIVKGSLGMISSIAGNESSSILPSIGILETVMNPTAVATSVETNLAQLEYYDKIRFYYNVMTSSPELPNQYGYPYYDESTLEDLETSGYYRTINANFSASNTPEENDQINTLLNGGFYYE